MKKFLIFLLVFVILAAGLGYLLYPTVAQQISDAGNARLMDSYLRKTRAFTDEEIEIKFSAAAEHNENMSQITLGDIFSQESQRSARSYQELLDIEKGILAELQIPRLNVSLPVYHSGTDAKVTEKLVHLEQSSLPSDQPGTYIALAGPGMAKAPGFLGEIGLKGARMLEDLDRLTSGDLLILTVLNRTMVYQVREVKILSQDGLNNLEVEMEPDQQKLVLLTRKNDRRLLVESERVQVEDVKDILITGDQVTTPAPVWSILIIGSPLFLLTMLVVLLIGAIKKRSYRLPDEGKRAELQAQEALAQMSEEQEAQKKITEETPDEPPKESPDKPPEEPPKEPPTDEAPPKIE